MARGRWVLLGCAVVLLAAGLSWRLAGDQPEPVRTTVRVDYRVVDGGRAHAETLEVDRPYRARTQVFDGDRRTGGFVWTESGVFTLKESGPQRSQDTAPSRPGPDSGLDVALPYALSRGLVGRAGEGRFAGRDCTWWSSRQPLEGGPFELPTASDEARTCVTPDGLVLALRWRIGGREAVTREAVSVSAAQALTDEVLFGGPAPGGGLGLLQVRGLTEPADPPLAVHAAAPAGHAFDRGAVTALLDAPEGQVTTASDVAVFVRDRRLAVLEEAQPQSGPEPAPTRGEGVDLGRLGTALLEPWYGGLRLSWVMPRSVVVHLSGPLTRDEIVSWARALVPRGAPAGP